MLNIESFIAWVKKHKMKTILVIIGLFFVPLIVVHLLFKWDTGYDFISAEWSAGDLIGYIAGFEAFVGTIVLGIIAVRQTDKANKTNDSLLKLTEENERKSVLPFLSFNSYIPKYEGNSFISLLAKAIPESKTNEDANKFIPIEDTGKRVDFLLSELNFTISHDLIKISAELCKEQQEKINCQFGIKKQTNGAALTVPDYHYDKIYIENCGKGSAINVKCRLYKVGNEGNDMLDVYSIPFTVPVEKHFDLGLHFDLTKKIHGSYRLVFTYQDIYMNAYRQTIPLECVEKTYTIDFYRPQEQLKKKIMSDING